MTATRQTEAERTLLVHLEGVRPEEREDPAEFMELAVSAGADVVEIVEVYRPQPTARFLIGAGKVEELAEQVREQQIELVIFNQALTPSQERNLERALECRVLDRIGLILDIFAQRAHTHEGKLQVELAQLEHISTRLIRSRTDLSRQQGGIGLRGPGETQLESDRRLLRVRMRQIRGRLEKVRNQRELARRGRRRAEIPAVSLVGYTNTGKSTLFNKLTTSGVYAADQLFATLDPTVRRLELEESGPVTLVDTVGFIRHLPHKLVEAFRATLEESASADLLLHVVDAAAGQRDEQVEQVEEVLDEIGAGDIQILEVYNKIDLLDAVQPHIQRNAEGMPVRVWLSAMQDQGLDLLLQAMDECLVQEQFQGRLCLPHDMARLRSQLFAVDAVQSEGHTEQGEPLLDIRMPLVELKKLLSREGLEFAEFERRFIQ
mgnify:CR=1 FL=1